MIYNYIINIQDCYYNSMEQSKIIDTLETYHSAPKSYLRRSLLPEFDEEVTDDVPLIGGQDAQSN